MLLEQIRENREAHSHETSLHCVDLAETAHTLRQEPEYDKNGRNGITLVKNPNLRVVLEVIRRGSGLGQHRAPGPITVQVLEGEIRFEVGEEAVYLSRGELISLPDRQPHAVEAVHDAAFLITIAPEFGKEPRS
jgi:quercetin dioxygenase-like cupin family protein